MQLTCDFVNKTGNTNLWTTSNLLATVGGQLPTPVLNNCMVVWCSITTICSPDPTSCSINDNLLIRPHVFNGQPKMPICAAFC